MGIGKIKDRFCMKKICFVSSSGGHWEELMCLKDIAEENNSFFVTEKSGQVTEENKGENTYLVSQINRREKTFFVKFIVLFAKAFKIMLKENPDVVITTGVLAAYPFCVVAKLMRKKVIYIESFARVYKKSLTGKLVYPFADLFVVQWESLLELYPKAVYGGKIF